MKVKAVQSILRIREIGVLIAILSISLVFFMLNRTFLSGENVMIILHMAATLGIISSGLTLLVISQEFDLSVGSIFVFCPILSTVLAKTWGINIWVSFFIGLIIGTSIGLLNGIIVTKAHIPSFITTLGTMLCFRGLSLIVCGGTAVAIPISSSRLLTAIGGTIFRFRFPSVIIWFFIFLFISWFILDYTPFGNKIYAVGSNKNAAFSLGINTDRVKIINFMYVGFLSSFAGFSDAFRLGSVSALSGGDLGLEGVGAVVVGGTSLLGGSGSVLGAGLGASLTGLIKNGLILAGVTTYWNEVFLGVIIIIAVIINRFLRRL